MQRWTYMIAFSGQAGTHPIPGRTLGADVSETEPMLAGEGHAAAGRRHGRLRS